MLKWPQYQSHHDDVQAMYMLAERAAKTKAPILIEGETGTGKEVLARYIHDHSADAAGPWVTINCAAMPDSMIEAIMFGYEKGSFTSAVQAYPGKFEQAHGGTLLLDEIGELPLSQQAKLLRVLQSHEVERLGAKQMIPVSVRVVAATNQDLKSRVEQGLFRMDLYYRLNVIKLVCIPLRERTRDIITLAETFLDAYQTSMEKSGLVLTQAAKDKLLAHNWPGNIRELENTIQRSVILDENGLIDAKDIFLQETMIIQNEDEGKGETKSLKATEAELILKVLNETKGLRAEAAKKLAISPRTLRHKLMKLREIGCEVP